MKSYVYAIQDEHRFVKIGKANNVNDRLRDLQVGNPEELRLVGIIECQNESHAIRLEKFLHTEYANYRYRGEWFHASKNLLEEFDKISHDDIIKKTRDPLIITTLFENEVEVFDNEMFPRCFFYPERSAQILTNYENAQRLTGHSKWRTMHYPTDGKLMLRLPNDTLLSDKPNLVFISSKKHEENLKLNRFLNSKNSTSNLLDFYK